MKLLIETEDRFQFQPAAVSPIWDTSYAAFTLGEMGGADPDAMRRSADWLLDREIRRKGDWSVKRPGLEPSGWAFEFANEHYPDIDDTAMVLLGLMHARGSDPARQERVEKEGDQLAAGHAIERWRMGGFRCGLQLEAAGGRPLCGSQRDAGPDVVRYYGPRDRSPVPPWVHDGARGDSAGSCAYLLEHQGSRWKLVRGRWGVNYIYGTSLAVRGLQASRATTARPAMVKALEWVKSVQNNDGGWGESCAGYAKGRFCWGGKYGVTDCLGIAHTGGGRRESYSEAAVNGVRYLIATQKPGGSWDERLATGTGFPGVFLFDVSSLSALFPDAGACDVEAMRRNGYHFLDRAFFESRLHQEVFQCEGSVVKSGSWSASS